MGLFAQIEAFLLTFLLGMLAGLIFHYYQSTIRSLRIGKYSLYVMDFFLWIIMIIIIAAALLLINQGEMRIYVFIALIAGGAAYHKYLARHLQQPVHFLGRATALLMHSILSIISKPFILGMEWVERRYRSWKDPPPIDDEPE